MQTRTLGQGLEVSAIGYGCMGLSQSYLPLPSRDEGIALIRARRRARCHLLRHRRGVRAVHQRGDRRRGARDRSATRSSSPPSSGSRSTSTASQTGLSSRPEHIREVGRGVTAAARRRRDRPVLPAPRRPGRADRGRRRRRQGPDRRRQGQAFRPVRGRRADTSAAPTPSSRSRPCRASTRCGGANPRPRCCRHSRSSASGSSRSARSARASSPGRSTRDIVQAGDIRAPFPRFGAEARQANQALVELLAAIARNKSATPAQVALAWLLAQNRGSCRSPAPAGSAGWTRTSARPTSNSPQPTSTNIQAAAARVDIVRAHVTPSTSSG